MDNATQDDAILISRAQNGDLDAFNDLVRRYQNRIYTVSYRLMGDASSAEDATQEAFIKAFRNIDSFRGGSFEGWLRRIASNTCYDELRKRQRRPITYLEDMGHEDSDDEAPIPSDQPTPEDVAQADALQSAIQRCIQALQDNQKMVMVMSDLEGMPYQEIADALGIAKGTVKSRLSRARLAVKRCLQNVSELLPPEFRLADNG
jgi:RNA polymerase sigma-70 factor (ECF subfamily)